MSADRSDARSGGISVACLLGLLIIALKLTGYIDWSWWWVLAPFWLPAAFSILLLMTTLLVLGLIVGVVALVSR